MTRLRLQTAFILIECLATTPTHNKFNCIYYISLVYTVMHGMVYVTHMIVVAVVLTNTYMLL